MTTDYGQPSKIAVRRKAIRHAVKLLTTRRDEAAIVPADHVERVRDALLESKTPGYAEAALACKPTDMSSWRRFRKRVVGKRRAAEITVAYLAGPEPTNDLDVLVEFGIAPENIWAFEVVRSRVVSVT